MFLTCTVRRQVGISALCERRCIDQCSVAGGQPRREHPRPLLPRTRRLDDRFDRCSRERPRHQPYRDPVTETALVPEYLLSWSAHRIKLHR
jgi:hypothetical protein